MLSKTFHSGNPQMRRVRAVSINLWRFAVLISVVWGLLYLGYDSIFLVLVGLPALAWMEITRRNGGPINHNTARSLTFSPITWFVLLCSLIGIVKLAFSLNFWIAVAPSFLILFFGWLVASKTNFLIPGCFACFKDVPFEALKSCPECSLKFAGGGWTGFKKHWEMHHQDIESYENVWKHMCAAHKKKGNPASIK